jgi:AraC family transcriptional regulator, ethanolamine operon transcriptional activator
MKMDMRTGTLDVKRIDTNDVGELAESFRKWDVELMQLHPGPFSGTIVMISLNSLFICRAMYSRPLLQRLTAPAACVTVTRMAAESDPVVCGGHEFERGECGLFGPGAEVEGFNRGVHYPTTVSIPLSVWEKESSWLSDNNLPRTRGAHFGRPGEAWLAGFLQRVEWILDSIARVPDATERGEVQNSMADSLLGYVGTLGDETSDLRNDRDTRVHRRLAVERARAYIAENLTEPIRLGDLCRHARTQARSLEYGFQELLSMSPIAYVRTIRLHRARRLLRSTAVRTRSISEIALDCGFWHLSQFALDYKLQFGESPSVTLKRTMAQLPRSERRRQHVWDLLPASRCIASLA